MCGTVVIAVAVALYTTITVGESNQTCPKPKEIEKIVKDVMNMCNNTGCLEWCNLISTVWKQSTESTEKPTCPTNGNGDSPTVVTTASTVTTTAADKNSAQSSQTSCDTVGKDGVSLGLAIGLLFVGLLIGVVITCLLCVCVPTLNRKATSVLSTRKVMKPKKDMMVPSAPQTSSKLEYESTLSVHDHRDSHIYTGIQTEIPLTDGKQITSPVYNVISENGNQASVAKGPNADYQELNDSRADDTYRQLDGTGNSVNNSIGPTEIEVEGDEASNHTYFTLNPHKVGIEDTTDMDGTTDNTAFYVLAKDISAGEEPKCES